MPLSFTIAFPSLSSICIAIAKKLHIPACKIIWPCYEATYHLANLVFPLPMVTLASTRLRMFLCPIFPPLYFTQGQGFYLPSYCLQNKCIKLGLTKYVNTRQMPACQATHLPTFYFVQCPNFNPTSQWSMLPLEGSSSVHTFLSSPHKSRPCMSSSLLSMVYKKFSIENMESIILSFTSQASNWRGSFINTIFNNVKHPLPTCRSFIPLKCFPDSLLHLPCSVCTT